MPKSMAAVRLAETLTGTDLAAIRDEYRDALEQVIAAKTGTAALPVPDEQRPAASAEVVDLMAMLEKSVQDAKTSRSQEATVHDLPTRKKTAKKTAAKKAAAAKRKPPRSA
ncbi:hypothetical protein [Streptomyces sp. cmx-4-9]|uniref:hypothetical protein n=1 Tax=Streptomyces sp. cmx-4-9 TaxID=2790941 RepID=UPI00397E96CF